MINSSTSSIEMHPQYTQDLVFDEFDEPSVVLISALWEGEERGAWWTGCKRLRSVVLTFGPSPIYSFCYGQKEFLVRNASDLGRFLGEVSELGLICIDLTNLPYEVWAPLVRKSLKEKIDFRVVYAEPREYSAKKRSEIFKEFDLSVEIGDIAGLPGFSYLGEDDEEFALVALLGFEGSRFGHFVEELEAEQTGKVYPVIGVPGFRPEFVRFAFEGNLHVLEKTKSSHRTRFARANCPFATFQQLQIVSSEIGSNLLKVALIGTRPHALGAVLFASLSQRKCSLLFDYPIRRSGRSSGLGKILLFDLSRFAREYAYSEF